MREEEIENRLNHTKYILHKCRLKGQININLMISDIEYLLNENNFLHKEINKRIKLKIENEKIVDTEFISKNKIREKIKELVNKNGEVLGNDRYEYAVRVLQELLGE